MLESFIFIIPTGIIVMVAIIVLSVFSAFTRRGLLDSSQILGMTTLFKYAVVLIGLFSIVGLLATKVS
ncbi:MAG: hypothetical protein ITG00_09185 [Flavobacterium sp.]|nr:hypothetical protein [Flavobacterium sp.]